MTEPNQPAKICLPPPPPHPTPKLSWLFSELHLELQDAGEPDKGSMQQRTNRKNTYPLGFRSFSSFSQATNEVDPDFYGAYRLHSLGALFEIKNIEIFRNIYPCQHVLWPLYMKGSQAEINLPPALCNRASRIFPSSFPSHSPVAYLI